MGRRREKRIPRPARSRRKAASRFVAERSGEGWSRAFQVTKAGRLRHTATTVFALQSRPAAAAVGTPRNVRLAEPTRTLAELRESADRLREQRSRREQKAREAARRKRLAAIAADPRKAIANIEKLAKERAVQSYEQAARELADLREALGPERGPAQPRAVAEKLRRENPRLIAALRKHGLLD